MKLRTLAFVAFAVFSPTLAHADIVVGNPPDPGGGNCFPFGCNFWAPEYQQVYASSNFSGSITIKDLEFFNTQFLGGSLDPGSYQISLSTTSKLVNGLDLTTLANNIGPDNTLVYSGLLPALSGGVLHIDLSTPFTYNPADGNLLMDVYSADPGSGSIYLDARNGTSGGVYSRAMSQGTGTDDWGLVTGFSTTGGVPEPSTWAMILAGFAALGYAGFRRSRPRGALV